MTEGEDGADADYLRFIATDIASHPHDASRLMRIADALDPRTPTATPSDEVVERVAIAIERADRDKVPDGYADGVSDHEEVSDWGVYLARAALAAIEGEKK